MPISNPGGASGWVTLGSFKATGTVASIDFSSIGSGYRHFLVILTPQVTVGADTLYVRFNGDSGANYNNIRTSYTSAAGSYGAEGTTGCRIGVASSSKPCSMQIFIANFLTGDSLTKATHASGGQYNNNGGDAVSGWTGTNEINQITLVCAANNFAIGTQAVLMGLAV